MEWGSEPPENCICVCERYFLQGVQNWDKMEGITANTTFLKHFIIFLSSNQPNEMQNTEHYILKE